MPLSLHFNQSFHISDILEIAMSNWRWNTMGQCGRATGKTTTKVPSVDYVHKKREAGLWNRMIRWIAG